MWSRASDGQGDPDLTVDRIRRLQSRVDGGSRFDGAALMRALDEQRSAQRVQWNVVAQLITAQSADLRARTNDHDLCSGALVRTVKRQTMSCQYALMLLRWLDRVPEDFTSAGTDARRPAARLPEAGPHQRLLWDLGALHAALDERRRESELTWAALAQQLGCSPARLTNLKKAREADMGLVMQVTEWIGRPSTDFISAVEY